MTVVEITDRLLGFSHEEGLALNSVKTRTGEVISDIQVVSVENEDGDTVIVLG